MKLHSKLPVIDGRTLGANCDECPLNGSTVVPPKVNNNATAIMLAESPGRTEEKLGAPLVGASGRVLDNINAKIGRSRARLHLTNTVMCKPPQTMSPTDWAKARECCRPRLMKELSKVKTKKIMAVGKHACTETTGKSNIMDWMGAPLPGVEHFEGYTILPMVHFAHALRYPEWIPVLVMHLARAWQMAEGTLPEWQWPEEVVDPGDEKKIYEALQRIKKARAITGVDVETNGLDPVNDELLNVGFSTTELAVSVTWGTASKRCKQLVKEICHDYKIPKVCHNGQHDILSITSNGMDFHGYVGDTLFLARLCAPRLKANLGFACCVDFHGPRWKSVFRQTSDTSGAHRFVAADPYERALYNARDCYMTVILYNRLLARLKKRVHNGEEQYRQYMALNAIAIESRRHGITTDSTQFDVHRKTLRRKKNASYRLLRELVAGLEFEGKTALWLPPDKKGNQADFNPSSAAHIRHVLINVLGVQPTAWSKKTQLPKFDEKALMDLMTHPSSVVKIFARNIIQFRKWQKYLKTYVEGLHVVKGRVHASPNPSGAKTGRWSYSDPNLQNIPKPVWMKRKNGTEYLAAPGLRDLFCASKGRRLVEFDYKQLEAFVLGFLSGDVKLLEMLKGDIHTETAKILFGERFINADDKQRKKMRELAKRARYAMHYGAKPETAWKALVVDFPELTLGDVQRLWKTFAKLHPQIVAWQQSQLQSAYEKDYVEAPLSGRRYYFYGFVEPTKCFNLPIQMTAADIINAALERVWKRIDKKTMMILVQVHDSLLAEANVGAAFNKLKKILKEELERPVEMNGVSVVFPTDEKEGENWGSLVELKKPEKPTTPTELKKAA